MVHTECIVPRITQDVLIPPITGPSVPTACIVPRITPDALISPITGPSVPTACIEGSIVPSTIGVRLRDIILEHRPHYTDALTYDGIGIENVNAGSLIISPETIVVLSITIGELLSVPTGITASTLPDVIVE